MSVFFAYMGIKIAKLTNTEARHVNPANISDEPEDKPVDYIQ
jgi:hypothetical protein